MHDEEIDEFPESTGLELGCGNSVPLESLKEGETVLDLGSGVGTDCFLAAKKIGKKGKVIGVDMNSEKISQAIKNAKARNLQNVEFKLGDLGNVPVNSNTIDVVISNCVINLVSDKKKVFQEAFRVLKPNGRLIVSDIIVLTQLPEPIIKSIDAYVQCVSGAILEDDFIQAIKEAGFEDVKIMEQTGFPIDVFISNPKLKDNAKKMGISMDELEELTGSVLNIKVKAEKRSKDAIKKITSDKLKIDIYVPLDACSCQWSQFMNSIFMTITPYIKHIKHETKSINSEDARKLQIHNKCVVIDGQKRYTSSHALKRDLPKLLKEKGLL